MRGAGGRIDAWRIAPVLVAAALAAVYLLWEPRTYDLAAAEFRAELFGEEPFGAWNNLWYSGHHTPAYSVLAPPLGRLLGPPLAIALAVVAAAALFERIAREHFGAQQARWGALWFGAGAASLAFTNRLPFAIGVALGLGAVLALMHGRRAAGLLLAALCGLASPVAGLFLALGGIAHALAGPPGRRTGAGLAIAAAGPPALLALAFPEGGHALFPLSAYLPIPIFCAACLLLLPREQRTLRIAAALYAAGATLALIVESPMGGNAVRLGALFGGPLLLCALPRPRSRGLLAVAAVGLAALAVWQWSPAVRDVRVAMREDSADEGYFDPLLELLEEAPAREPGRVEIPFTLSHWEGAEVAPHHPLARGWERQLDTERNALFYDEPLTQATYARWLEENAVRWVAVPGARLDPAGEDEAELIAGGLPYLRERERRGDWTLYEVTLPAPLALARGRARVEALALGADSARLRFTRPGTALLRVRWSRYWRLAGGCVERAGEWTRVSVREPGDYDLTIRVTPARLVSGARRCED